MQQRLKRWESPRKRGRNDKGKGGSARARQIRKQQKMLRQQLKDNSENKSANNQQKRKINLPLSFYRLEIKALPHHLPVAKPWYRLQIILRQIHQTEFLRVKSEI